MAYGCAKSRRLCRVLQAEAALLETFERLEATLKRIMFVPSPSFI
jgi:hypothetical protein